MKTMTVKEIAEVAGCHTNTVYAHIKKCEFPIGKGKGSPMVLMEKDAITLIERLPKKNMIIENNKIEIEEPQICETSILINAIDKMQSRQESFMLKIVEMLTPKKEDPPRLESKPIAVSMPQKPLQLPLPEVPTITPRQEISQIVRGYVHSQKQAVTYSDAWKRLFREFRNRHGVDLIVRAKNRGCKSLDYAETEGIIMQVLALANILFVEV